MSNESKCHPNNNTVLILAPFLLYRCDSWKHSHFAYASDTTWYLLCNTTVVEVNHSPETHQHVTLHSLITWFVLQKSGAGCGRAGTRATAPAPLYPGLGRVCRQWGPPLGNHLCLRGPLLRGRQWVPGWSYSLNCTSRCHESQEITAGKHLFRFFVLCVNWFLRSPPLIFFKGKQTN